MNPICRAAFFSIATQKRRRIKPGLLLNARCSWIPSSRLRGRGWPRLTSGIATMPPRWRVPESDAALEELIAIASETGAYQIAEIYGYRNDKDRAFEWLERARRQR